MKNCLAAFIGLVCVGFALSHMHIPPKTCYSCVERNLTLCNSNMMMDNCTASNVMFPNIGEGDCYTAVGWYMVNGAWQSGVLRGCINCTMQAAALNYLKMRFDQSGVIPNANLDLSIMYSTLSCCNSTNCNNMDVSLPPTPTPTPTMMINSMSSEMTPTSTDDSPTTSDGYVYRVSPVSGILVIVMFAVGLLSK